MKIAIFASGSGSNAENIAKYFANNDKVEVELILTNNPKAFVIERAKKLSLKCVVFNREEFSKSDKVLNILKEHGIDFLVLAGFLWLVPNNLVKAFANKMVNIDTALLPKYGGKGMYGDKVHEAVVANKEKETGITIHYVNENYDDGNIIFQAKCSVNENDTAKDVANKVHELEYKHFPQIIENLIVE